MQILADTSVWIDHLRRRDSQLGGFLAAGDVVVHDQVLGELCLGGLSRKALAMMQLLRHCAVASHDEVMHLIAERRLAGRGLGYVDAHLLAAALIGRLRLWTLDQALQRAARDCGCALANH